MSVLDTDGATAAAVLWSLLVAVLAFAGSLTVVGILLVRLPATYFLDKRPPPAGEVGHPLWRWIVVILKNSLGALLVLVGLLMLFTPGQGIMTILIGLLLLNFPGKRRLERALVGRPGVLPAINRWRAQFGKAPIQLAEGAPPTSKQPERPPSSFGFACRRCADHLWDSFASRRDAP